MKVQQCILKIDNLFKMVRKAVINETYQHVGLSKYKSVFNDKKLCYQEKLKIQLGLNLQSLQEVVRILEILVLVRSLLLTSQTITKRSLYYKLIKYYKFYAQIDDDLQIITSSLKIPRQYLNIIASNRCVISGNVTIVCDGEITTLTNTVITKVPNCKNFRIECPQYFKLLIIEKQSAFCSLHHDLLTYKSMCSSSQEVTFIDSILMITSKGYPDFLTRLIISDLQYLSQIYYIGDQDIYGFDILLCYAFNVIPRYQQQQQNEAQKLLYKIKWLQPKFLITLELISLNMIKNQMMPITVYDRKKYQEIINRGQFKVQTDINSSILKIKFYKKVRIWKQALDSIILEGKKCQLQGYIKYCIKSGWVLDLMMNKCYK